MECTMRNAKRGRQHTNEWTNKQTHKWMNGWMDEWKNRAIAGWLFCALRNVEIQMTFYLPKSIGWINPKNQSVWWNYPSWLIKIAVNEFKSNVDITKSKWFQFDHNNADDDDDDGSHDKGSVRGESASRTKHINTSFDRMLQMMPLLCISKWLLITWCGKDRFSYGR